MKFECCVSWDSLAKYIDTIDNIKNQFDIYKTVVTILFQRVIRHLISSQYQMHDILASSTYVSPCPKTEKGP